MIRISLVAEQLLALQEGFNSMELVGMMNLGGF
jgi:hypothetical protein